MLVVTGWILTLQLHLISVMPSFPPGVPQAAGETGSLEWLGDTSIPVQQGPVGYARPAGLQAHPGIIVLLYFNFVANGIADNFIAVKF